MTLPPLTPRPDVSKAPDREAPVAWLNKVYNTLHHHDAKVYESSVAYRDGELIPLYPRPSADARDAISKLNAIADCWYADYIRQLQKPECLGRDHKMQTGGFGILEFEAHHEAALRLGRHQGVHEAIKVLTAALDAAMGRK